MTDWVGFNVPLNTSQVIPWTRLTWVGFNIPLNTSQVIPWTWLTWVHRRRVHEVFQWALLHHRQCHCHSSSRRGAPSAQSSPEHLSTPTRTHHHHDTHTSLWASLNTYMYTPSPRHRLTHHWLYCHVSTSTSLVRYVSSHQRWLVQWSDVLPDGTPSCQSIIHTDSLTSSPLRLTRHTVVNMSCSPSEIGFHQCWPQIPRRKRPSQTVDHTALACVGAQWTGSHPSLLSVALSYTATPLDSTSHHCDWLSQVTWPSRFQAVA